MRPPILLHNKLAHPFCQSELVHANHACPGSALLFLTGVVHGFLKAEWQYEDFEELLALYEKVRD